MAKRVKRPVYLVVKEIEAEDGGENPVILIAIKQTSLSASIEAGKHEGATVKKGFVTQD